MAKITVYRVRRYDISSDGYVLSKRMMTEEGARKICGEILPETGLEIEESELESGEDWTVINFRPQKHGDGIQTQVMP